MRQTLRRAFQTGTNMAAPLRSVSAHHVSHLRSHWSRRGHMSRGTYNVRQIVRKKANGKKLKETDTDKFPSEKKLSRKFFFRISRRIWQFCRDLSSSLVGKFRQVTRDAISDLCTDTVRHKYPVARPDIYKDHWLISMTWQRTQSRIFLSCL